MYIFLWNERPNTNEKSWDKQGEDGPVIGPFESIRFMGDSLTCCIENGGEINIELENRYFPYNGKWYGDFTVCRDLPANHAGLTIIDSQTFPTGVKPA